MVHHSPPPTAEFEHTERGKRVRSKSESVSDHPLVSLCVFFCHDDIEQTIQYSAEDLQTEISWSCFTKD